MVAAASYESASSVSGTSDRSSELLERVRQMLVKQGYLQHRHLDLTVSHGVVCVSGHLPTFYLRQMAVECIKRVAGVDAVVDRIVVRDVEEI